jgi:hypothetical protein
MATRGLVYLVTARRTDGGWIHYRTCDRSEARSWSDRLGCPITIE